MRVPSVQGLLIALHTRPPSASVRPSVRLRLGGGRLTGRGDRIRQKLFPVRTHVHRPRRKPQRRGLNRAPHSRAIHTSSIYPSFSALCSLINRWTVLTSSQPTTMQFSRRFISLFGVDHGPATSCLHSPSVRLSFPPSSAKRIYLFRGGGKTNVTILLVRRRGEERDGGKF